MEDFGIIVVCYRRDFWMARACLESIHHFCPDTPVCLLVDGSLRPNPKLLPSGTRVLLRDEVPESVFHERTLKCETKMIAYWHSPFRQFLLLDADTLVWGDIATRLKGISGLGVDARGRPFTRDELRKWFFDPDLVHNLFPDRHWDSALMGNAGVVVGQRGVFDLAELEAMLRLRVKHPMLSHLVEQGYLMLLMQWAAAEGRTTLHPIKLQYIACDHSREEMQRRFPVKDLDRGTIEESIVIHYPGVLKPFSNSRDVFADPVSHFRARSYQRHPVLRLIPAPWLLRLEDWLFVYQTRRSLPGRMMRRLQIVLEAIWKKLVEHPSGGISRA